MRTDILMVSHGKDLAFASYALRSVKKYATGFAQVVIVVPDADVPAFYEMAHPMGFNVYGFSQMPGKGMLHHQVQVLRADLWCPGADLILHLDSDCLFTRPVTPEEYIREGKPVLYRERYEDFAHHPYRPLWKSCVFRATGITPEWETMVRHPGVFKRETYGLTRDLIRGHTGQGHEPFVLSCENNFPQSFAEYPALGAVAIQCHPELYSFVDWSNRGKDYTYHGDALKQFWSHHGVDFYRAELDSIVK